MIASVVILCLLISSFAIIYICQKYAIMLGLIYPKVDCDSITSIYGSELMSYAYKEYHEFFEFTAGKIPMTGKYECFCKNENLVHGFSVLNKVYTIPGTTDSFKLCHQWYLDSLKELFFGNIVSYLLIMINFVLRLIIIGVIKRVGKMTETDETQMITDGVFIVQFFNTAMLLLMVNANMTEQAQFFEKIMSGVLPDFTAQWYNDTGFTLIGAMVFNVYWPIIEFFVYYGMRYGMRALDRGFFSCDPYKTNKITI